MTCCRESVSQIDACKRAECLLRWPVTEQTYVSRRRTELFEEPQVLLSRVLVLVRGVLVHGGLDGGHHLLQPVNRLQLFPVGAESATIRVVMNGGAHSEVAERLFAGEVRQPPLLYLTLTSSDSLSHAQELPDDPDGGRQTSDAVVGAVGQAAADERADDRREDVRNGTCQACQYTMISLRVLLLTDRGRDRVRVGAENSAGDSHDQCKQHPSSGAS